MSQAEPTKPKLILITGIMAAGKSSVAQRLAERLPLDQFPRSVHLRGDLFRRLIVNGRADMGVDLTAEALAQLQLRYRLAAASAALYLDAGFSVIYQDIIMGEGLREVLAMHVPHPVHVVVLCPDPAVVAVREESRPKSGYENPEDVAAFDHILRTETPPIGLWLNSSNLTLDETVDHILDDLPRALVMQ